MPGLDSVGTAGIVPRILAVIRELRELNSLDAILDRLLLAARQMVRADAGTLFLVEGDRLVFSYVHNDSLFSSDEVTRHVYLNASLPMDGTSIAGTAAAGGQAVVIDDAYSLDSDGRLRFNGSFDARTGYHTRSVAALPLTTTRGRVIAVMQLINPADAAGRPRTFAPDDLDSLSLLADQAATAIETGLLTEEFILRMNKMAELRDPAETGAHVKRVGAYAAEVYHAMAARDGLPVPELKRRKDMIRIAAMLHDVGKVGISDTILKKPGRLTPAEHDVVKRHTLYGARLFANPSSELDAVVRDVVLHHHQRFDGTGYPGRNDDIEGESATGRPALAGEAIPLAARITALADVYDALVSVRVYKPPFDEAEVEALLREQAGFHFDPAVLAAFFSIKDVIVAIREKYGEQSS